MPTGTEVGVAYVSIVPSARNFAGQLRNQISPAQMGKEIGAELSKGLESALKLDPVNVKLQGIATTSGTKVGSAVGGSLSKAMGDHIDGGVRRGLDSLKRLSIGFAGIVGGGLVMGKQFFDAASDLGEASSKAQVVFGDAFGAIDQMAQNSAKSMGLSRQQALDAAATFGNLFRSMGMGTGESAQMSSSILQLAGDLASFNNVPVTDALDALRSGLVGETEPLRRFGITINEDRIQAEAMRKGIVKTNVDQAKLQKSTVRVDKATSKAADALAKHGKDSIEYRDAIAEQTAAEAELAQVLEGKKIPLDAAQKAQATYSLIMQDSTLAQGDFARTADGAANKQRMLTAEWENTKSKIGTALLPIGTTFLDLANQALTSLQNWWTVSGPGVMQWLTDFRDGLFGAGTAEAQAGGEGTIFDKVRVALDNIFGTDKIANYQTGVDTIKGWWNELFGEGSAAATTAPTTLDNIRTKLDDIFGVDKLASFQAGADIVATKMDEVFGEDKLGNFQRGADELRTKWDGLWEDFENGSIRVSRVTAPIFENLGKVLVWLKDKVLDPLFGFIKDTLLPFGIDQLVGSVTHAVDMLGKMIDTTGKFIAEVLDPIIGTLQDLWDKLQQARDNPVISAAMRAMGIPGFAAGGVVPGALGSPQPAVVHGGETILPTHRAQYAALRGITAAALTGGAATPSPTLAIEHLEVSGQNDPNATAWAIRRELRRVAYFSGAA